MNGEITNTAATVIQANFKGHLERKETGSHTNLILIATNLIKKT